MATELRQSEGWAKFLRSQGWEVEVIRHQRPEIRIYIKKIPLLGSVIKVQRPPVIPPVEEIDKLAKKHRAFCAKLEPLPTTNYQLPTMEGFEPDPSPSLPTQIIVIDLTKSEKELWKALSQDTRHDIREAESNQLSVISYQGTGIREQLKKFHQLLKETGRRQGFWAPSFNQLKAKTEAFGKNALLFLAYPPRQPDNQTTEQPIAGALILIHGATAYYHYTATSITGRKLNATYLLMWGIIKSCKQLAISNKPIKFLDLGSVYDPRYHRATKNWQNFSTFKRKWHGREIKYPIPLIKYYHPLAKLILKLS